MPVYPPTTQAGLPIPNFTLPGVDGKIYSSEDFKNGQPLVVMFICNHCPYVKAIEDRLITLGHDLKKHHIHVVAICSNDEITYPEDAFENLKARYFEKNYSFYYLHDKTQAVAKSFGAVCTPDYFVYDKKGQLAYRGRLDDSWKDPSQVTKRELYDAVMLIKNNQPLNFTETASMGCSIKWIKETL